MGTIYLLNRGGHTFCGGNFRRLSLFTGVWCGASCYNHLDIVRFDPTLCHLMGYEKGPDHRAYQCYFNKFSQAVNQRVFDSLYSWVFSELCFDNYTLDFDPTVMERCGEQDGVVYRNGEVYRDIIDRTSGHCLESQLIRTNHARVMYDCPPSMVIIEK